MRFMHNFTGEAVYVVKPRTRNVINGIPVPDPGVRAEFKNGQFDSERAQALYGWTDDTRDLVERFLLSHADFGRPVGAGKPSIHLADVPGAQVVIGADGNPEIVVPERKCGFLVTTGTGTEPCGKPAKMDDRWCIPHGEELLRVARENETNPRERVVAGRRGTAVA